MDLPAHLAMIEKLNNLGAAAILQLSPTDSFYPPLFATLTSILTLTSLDVFTSMWVVVMLFGALVFPLSMLYFYRSVFVDQHRALTSVIVPVCSVLTQPFIAYSASTTRYAYFIATCLLPLLLGQSLRLLKLLPTVNPKTLIAPFVRLLLVILVIIFAQPRVLFLFLVLLLPFLVHNMILLRRNSAKRFKILVLTLTCFCSLSFLLLILYTITRLRPELLYHPENWFPSFFTFDTPSVALTRFTLLKPLGDANISAGVVMLLFVLGAQFARKLRLELQLVLLFLAGYAILLVLYVIRTVNSAASNILTAPFYKEGDRIIVGVSILLTALFAHIFVRLWTNLAQSVRKVRIPVCIALVCLISLGFVVQTADVRAFSLNLTRLPTFEQQQFFNQPREDFIRRVQPLVPETGIILSDPSNGSVYVESLIGRKVVFPFLNASMTRHENFEYLLHDLEGTKSEQFVSRACSINPQFFILDLDNYYTPRPAAEYNYFIILHSRSLLGLMTQGGQLTQVLADPPYALYKVNC
jgi:hypothetical protein